MITNKRKQVEEQCLRDSSNVNYSDYKGISMYEEPPQNTISLSDF